MTLSCTIPRDRAPSTPSPPGVTLLLLTLQHPAAQPSTSGDMPTGGSMAGDDGNTITTVTTPSIDLDMSRKRRAVLALASAQRDLHRYTLDTLGATLSGEVPAGGHSSCARHTVFLAKRVKIMSIILDRACGATWDTIGQRWGLDAETAENLFGPMEQAWTAGDPAPWAPRVDGVTPAGMMPIHLDADSGADLADYYWGHSPPRPVGRVPGAN
jgi:hypothetical protein